MITHSNLSRIIVYLRGLYSGRINSLREYQMLNRCSRVDRNIVEEFCDKCCLTRLTHNANDILTAKGRNIIELCINDNGVEQFFRHLLKEYIREVKPGWAYKIPSGRAESLAAMTDDEKFCFFEAGLMRDPASLDDVKWWDDVASYFRPSDEDFLLRIGRRGEYLTMQYELERTNCSPRWISIESNYAGFDILSRNDARSTDKRLIEVKSTERFENEEFIITQHEWDTALTSMNNYYFYLWKLGDVNTLAIVSAIEMSQHIARNVGLGRWMSVSVPFYIFNGRFKNFHS